MIILRPLHLGDIMWVICKLPEEEKQQIAAFVGEFNMDKECVRCASLPGPKWAVVDEDHPHNALAMGGFIPQRPGVFQTWFLAQPEAWARGREVTELLDATIKAQLENGAHRIETICLASREKARRWYPRIGLNFETTLARFGCNGEDAVVHVALEVKR